VLELAQLLGAAAAMTPRGELQDDDGPTFVRPTIGRVVHYFPDDERKKQRTGRVWAAIITGVHEPKDGEEPARGVVSLHVFPPADGRPRVVDIPAVPLAGMYDLEDVLAHPEWVGCWNWPLLPLRE